MNGLNVYIRSHKGVLQAYKAQDKDFHHSIYNIRNGEDISNEKKSKKGGKCLINKKI